MSETVESNEKHVINNLQIEIRFVGAVYKNPDLLINYGQYIRPQYDFTDEMTRFFYESADLIYRTASQVFTKTNVTSFMMENQERLSTYERLGGWKTVEMLISQASDGQYDEKKTFEILKKFSLLRQYDKNGMNVMPIINHKKFDLWNASQVYKAMRTMVDKVNTKIMGDTEVEILNSKVDCLVDSCLESPDMGFEIPFPILNETFMGMQQKTIMAVAAMSNAGKSRLMIKMVAYATLVLRQKTLVLLNEMTVDKMRRALLTTVLNNPEYKNLHGIDIVKPEREVVMGEYKDKYGTILKRGVHDIGNGQERFKESQEDFLKRVQRDSDEYQKVKQVADWIDKQTQSLIYVKDVSSDYSDQTLEFEIKKAVATKGVKLFFYDTCKNEQSGEWSAFKITVSRLSELCKNINVFGYLSMQLNDETNRIEPDRMNSSCIAEAKQTKHVLDSLIMIKEIDRENYKKYRYIPYKTSEWCSDATREQMLSDKRRYYCFVVDKNRGGNKPKLLFEVNLDTNVWTECGILKRVS